MKNFQTNFERCEKKYFLSLEQKDKLINIISKYLKDDPFKFNTICNIYYDTDDYTLIRKSIEKPAFKEKLRVRSYGDDSEVFIELKKKYKGIVYKRRLRIESSQIDSFFNGSLNITNNQIAKEILYFQKIYNAKPKIYIKYNRESYMAKFEPGIRMTFDTNICFSTNNLNICSNIKGTPIIPHNKILMEIKILNSCPLWLANALTKVGAFPISFSKYGTCYSQYILKQQIKERTKVITNA